MIRRGETRKDLATPKTIRGTEPIRDDKEWSEGERFRYIVEFEIAGGLGPSSPWCICRTNKLQYDS